MGILGRPRHRSSVVQLILIVSLDLGAARGNDGQTLACQTGGGLAETGQTASVMINEGEGRVFEGMLNCTQYSGGKVLVSVGIEVPEGCTLLLAIWRPRPNLNRATTKRTYSSVATVIVNKTSLPVVPFVVNGSLTPTDALGVFVLNSSNETDSYVSGAVQACQWNDSEAKSISCSTSPDTLVDDTRTLSSLSQGTSTMPSNNSVTKSSSSPAVGGGGGASPSSSTNIIWVVIGGSSSSLLVLLLVYLAIRSLYSRRRRRSRKITIETASASVHSSAKRLLARSQSDPFGSPNNLTPVSPVQGSAPPCKRQLSYAGSIPSVHRSTTDSIHCPAVEEFEVNNSASPTNRLALMAEAEAKNMYHTIEENNYYSTADLESDDDMSSSDVETGRRKTNRRLSNKGTMVVANRAFRHFDTSYYSSDPGGGDYDIDGYAAPDDLRMHLANIAETVSCDVEKASMENLRLDESERFPFNDLFSPLDLDEDSGLQTELACDSGSDSPYDEAGTFPSGTYIPNADDEFLPGQVFISQPQRRYQSDEESDGHVCKVSLKTNSASSSPMQVLKRPPPEGKSRPSSAHSSRPHSRTNSCVVKKPNRGNNEHQQDDKALHHCTITHHLNDKKQAMRIRDQGQGGNRHAAKETAVKRQLHNNIRNRPATPVPIQSSHRRGSLNQGVHAKCSYKSGGNAVEPAGVPKRRQRPMTFPVDVSHLYSSVDGSDSEMSHSYTCASEVPQRAALNRSRSCLVGNTSNAGSTPEGNYDAVIERACRCIPRERVHLMQHIGSGAFGVVWQGKWRKPDGSCCAVAVKELRGESDNYERRHFIEEADIMARFSHENIVRLLGVVRDKERPLMVLELMENGSVLSFLRCVSLNTTGRERLPAQLMSMSLDVARGLLYLQSRSFIHRDLAARNLLLSADLRCKIGDFGLSRLLDDDVYYRSRGGKLPVKWCALEVIRYRKFTLASDIWSFGIVLFEMWSLGRKPYFPWTALQVAEEVCHGYRLPPPPGTTQDMYQIMHDCWHPIPRERPTAKELTIRLGEAAVDLRSHNLPNLARQLGQPFGEVESTYPDLQRRYANRRQ